MGNDSGLRQKSKQRTTVHKKHTVFPGMKLGAGVKIESGSIKPLFQRGYTQQVSAKKVVVSSDPLMIEYEKAAAGLQNGYNSSAARGNFVEREYALAYKKLVREGKAPKLKRKYTKI